MPQTKKRKPRFVGLPYHIVVSAEWQQLKGNEIKLLIELFAQYNGKNNGDFSCAWSQLRHKGWNSPLTLNKAKQGLLEKGWIEETRKGITGRCSLYAVTWEAIDDRCGKLEVKATQTPSMLFKKINNPNTLSV